MAVVVVFVAVYHFSALGQSSRQAQQTVVTPSTEPVSLPPLAVTSIVPRNTPGSSSPTPSVQNSAPALEQVPVPTDSRSMSLYIVSKQVGIIPAKPAKAPEIVMAFTVPEGATQVTPPEPGGAGGCSWKGPSEVEHHSSVPKDCDWSDTSEWVTASAYPSSPSRGTTYVYGHACTRHLCPFTAIQRKPDGSYTVASGDTIFVGTPTGTLTYRVCNVGPSPKSGKTLQVPGCDQHHVDLVVTTCQEVLNQDSTTNIVVAAYLVAATHR